MLSNNIFVFEDTGKKMKWASKLLFLGLLIFFKSSDSMDTSDNHV